MHKFYPELQILLLWIEFIAAIVAIFYYRRLRKSHWKWFVVYLVFILFQEGFWAFVKDDFPITVKQVYYGVFGIPIQYIFLYWLYALKSLKNKKVFVVSVILYSLTIPLQFFLDETRAIESINLSVGIGLLTILVILEFINQIKTDNILRFLENKMFYINIAVVLGYIGIYPLFAFYNSIYDHPNIWNIYFLYFRISGCLMYLLFAISFIWGRKDL